MGEPLGCPVEATGPVVLCFPYQQAVGQPTVTWGCCGWMP